MKPKLTIRKPVNFIQFILIITFFVALNPIMTFAGDDNDAVIPEEVLTPVEKIKSPSGDTEKMIIKSNESTSSSQEPLFSDFQPNKLIPAPQPKNIKEEKIDNKQTEEKTEVVVEPEKQEEVKRENRLIAFNFLNESQNVSYEYYSNLLPYYIILQPKFQEFECFRYNIMSDKHSLLTQEKDAYFRKAMEVAKKYEATYFIIGNYRIHSSKEGTPEIDIKVSIVFVPTGESLDACAYNTNVSVSYKGDYGLKPYTTLYDLVKALAPCVDKAIANFKPTPVIKPKVEHPRGGLAPLQEPLLSSEPLIPLSEPFAPTLPKIKKPVYYFHSGFKFGPNFTSLNNSQANWSTGFVLQPFIYTDAISYLDLELDISFKRSVYNLSETYRVNGMKYNDQKFTVDTLSLPLPIILKPNFFLYDVIKPDDYLKIYFPIALRINFVFNNSNKVNTKLTSLADVSVPNSDMHGEFGVGFQYNFYDDLDFIFEYHFMKGLTTTLDTCPYWSQGKHIGHEFLFGLKFLDF